MLLNIIKNFNANTEKIAAPLRPILRPIILPVECKIIYPKLHKANERQMYKKFLFSADFLSSNNI